MEKEEPQLFNEFWNKNKNIIECVGILSALGALFLAIPLPENERAKEALIQVQFLWVFIISIAMMAFGWAFMKFAFKLNDYLEKKMSWNTNNFIGVFAAMVFLYVLTGLWRYMFALYQNEWTRFMESTEGIFIAVIILAEIEIIIRIYKKFANSKTRFVLALFTSLLLAPFPFLWIQFAHLSFEVGNFLKLFFIFWGVNLVIYLGFVLIILVRRRKLINGKNKS